VAFVKAAFLSILSLISFAGEVKPYTSWIRPAPSEAGGGTGHQANWCPTCKPRSPSSKI